MNPNISSFVSVNNKIKIFSSLWVKATLIQAFVLLPVLTAISSSWELKFTEKHSKLPDAFATIHQVITIQCVSQHSYVVAVGRVTVDEALKVLFCGFIFFLFTENKIKYISIQSIIQRSKKHYIWRLGGSNRTGLIFLPKVALNSLLEAIQWINEKDLSLWFLEKKSFNKKCSRYIYVNYI